MIAETDGLPNRGKEVHQNLKARKIEEMRRFKGRNFELIPYRISFHRV